MIEQTSAMDITRLSALSDAVMDVAKGEDLRSSLKRLIENAVIITDCTYGALGSIAADGSLEDFTYIGMSDETADEIETFPEGKGLLGHLLKVPEPLRVSVIRDHPSSSGFPKGHPAMGHMMMNFSANLLGLDNAATPFGIKAMESLQEINPDKTRASNAQLMFLCLHASGLTLIPTIIIADRVALKSAHPTDIFIPCMIEIGRAHV